jgi:site-specific DNA-cytosine methylase
MPTRSSRVLKRPARPADAPSGFHRTHEHEFNVATTASAMPTRSSSILKRPSGPSRPADVPGGFRRTDEHEFTVATPFTGLDGVGAGAAQRGYRIKQNNLYENNKHLEQYLTHKFGRSFEGPKDIFAVDLADWESADVLFCGPPCQPNSPMGSRNGLADPRAQTLFRTLEAAKSLDAEGKLLAIVLENSPSLLATRPSGNFFDAIADWWAKEMKHWTAFDCWAIDAKHCGLPTNRKRLFLVACPLKVRCIIAALDPTREFVGHTPFVMPPKEHQAVLDDFLDEDLCGFDTSTTSELWPKMRENAKAWRKLFTKMIKDNPDVKYATVDLSRDPNSNFKAYLTPNMVMSPTTQNRYMAVFGTGNKAPRAGRFLTMGERARIMGFDYDAIKYYMSVPQAVKAIGNAIAAPVASAVLGAIFKELNIVVPYLSSQGLRSSFGFNGAGQLVAIDEEFCGPTPLIDEFCGPTPPKRRRWKEGVLAMPAVARSPSSTFGWSPASAYSSPPTSNPL